MYGLPSSFSRSVVHILSSLLYYLHYLHNLHSSPWGTAWQLQIEPSRTYMAADANGSGQAGSRTTCLTGGAAGST